MFADRECRRKALLQPLKSNISVHSILTATVLAIGTLAARAQSIDDSPGTSPATQPAAAASVRVSRGMWNSTVSAFANALVDPSDLTMHTLVSDELIVRQFNRAGRQEMTHLRDHVSGMHLIMSRAYLQTPTMLASDLATAMKDVPLPDEIKRRLTPGDEAALKRANAIASKWIGASLFTSGSEPVAILVLWKEGIEAPATQPASGDDKDEDKAPAVAMPVFILLKGDVVGDRIVISQICFGDPLIINPGAGDGSTAVSGN